MNLFTKLSDPVYFRRTAAKTSIAIGVLGVCLFTTVGIWLASNHEGKPGIFGFMVLMSVSCIGTGIRKLKG